MKVKTTESSSLVNFCGKKEKQWKKSLILFFALHWSRKIEPDKTFVLEFRLCLVFHDREKMFNLLSSLFFFFFFFVFFSPSITRGNKLFFFLETKKNTTHSWCGKRWKMWIIVASAVRCNFGNGKKTLRQVIVFPLSCPHYKSQHVAINRP